MTVAGISSLTIAQIVSARRSARRRARLLRSATTTTRRRQAIDAGARWLGAHFQIRSNPGGGDNWTLYYLYGLERAGTAFGPAILRRSRLVPRRSGSFSSRTRRRRTEPGKSAVAVRSGPRVRHGPRRCCFCPKGLAPVLINKLKFGPRDPASGEPLSDDWSRHLNDVRNLVDFISLRDKWPHLLTWQVVDLDKAAAEAGRAGPAAGAGADDFRPRRPTLDRR